MCHRTSLAILIPLILIGAALRFGALGQETRFHPDEALFATFARDAAVHGRWLLPGALDKPPLSLYAAALTMHFVGVQLNPLGVLDLDRRTGEFAARLPGAYAGIVLSPLVYALAFALTRDRMAALLAAALTACSPMLAAYSPTAFTDPLMLTLMLAALVAAARGRAAWSGVLLALAFASKQQAIFYMPLIAWLVWTRPDRAALLRFGVAFALGVGGLLAWDVARPEDSLFALAAVNNNPERALVTLAELPARLGAWLRAGAPMFGPALLTALVMLAASVAGWRVRALRPVALYTAGYLLLHWLAAFNTYDRYLLPVAPLLALLAAHTPLPRERGLRAVLPALLILLMLAAAPRFADDDRARDAQLIALADAINAQPLGTIIYDHWLGWQMGYYIGAWSDKRRVYYPDADTLAADALNNPDPAPRYLIAPTWADTTRWLAALCEAGFAVEAAYHSADYRMTRLIPPWARAATSASGSCAPDQVWGDG